MFGLPCGGAVARRRVGAGVRVVAASPLSSVAARAAGPPAGNTPAARPPSTKVRRVTRLFWARSEFSMRVLILWMISVALALATAGTALAVGGPACTPATIH